MRNKEQGLKNYTHPLYWLYNSSLLNRVHAIRPSAACQSASHRLPEQFLE